AAAIGAAVTQKGDEIADAGIADPEHPGARRLVPQFVDLDRLEIAARRQEADRPLVDKFPCRPRDLAAPVALAGAHGELRRLLVERGGGIGQTVKAAVAGLPRADVELVADPPGDRLPAIKHGRKIAAEI